MSEEKKSGRYPWHEVVEVVRCKECKHHADETLGMVYCPEIVGGWVSNDCFCSWGERKEEQK